MEYGGIAIANSFDCIAADKKIEMPVAENLQLGISTGLAITGFTPISVYPRWNFLLLASDQLVNHLDKISDMTTGQYAPKVIIRVAVGVREPVDPQEQHVGDFTDGFKKILKNINVVKLDKAEDILEEYKKAYSRTDGISTILVEEHQFG
jgi:pyruvate/2-oxoglutarate/acetoin dehydrogenase E1 component